MADVILTTHAKYRLLERGIGAHDAKKIAKSGQITKTEANGTITKEGVSYEGRRLIVIVIKDSKNRIIIKTAYYAN